MKLLNRLKCFLGLHDEYYQWEWELFERPQWEAVVVGYDRLKAFMKTIEKVGVCKHCGKRL